MIEKLRQLKKKSQMTNQQIAEKSNIPESTVARIFSGKTPNPTVATVVAMARAMGGSPADLMNDEDIIEAGADAEKQDDGGDCCPVCDKCSAASEPNSAKESLPPEYSAAHERFYEDIISLYKVEMKKKDVWLARLFWCLAIIVLFILIVLIFDITHPNFGYVKY